MGKQYLREAETKKCIYQLLKLVKEMHGMRIRHSQISLDTILTKRSSRGLDIKLTSFELAKEIKRPQRKSSKNLEFAS